MKTRQLAAGGLNLHRRVLNRLKRVVSSPGSGRSLNGLDGSIETFDDTRLTGWATRSGPPLHMSLLVDGVEEVDFIANAPRPDVKAAGRGPLECGFDIAMPRYLKNGRGYRLEVKVKGSNQQLNGNLLQIHGSADANSVGDRSAFFEGVAFFDPDQQTIGGWAMGVTRVSLRINAGNEVTIPLDREVPGFGGGILAGFSYPVPDAFRDGKSHQARVTFGDTSVELDCSPVSFSCQPKPLSVELTGQSEHSAHFRVFPCADSARDIALTARAGDQKVELHPTQTGFDVDLPQDGADLTIESPDGTRIARFRMQAGILHPPSPLRVNEDRLTSPEALQLARAAFDAFCEQPDTRFDPDWYRKADPQAAGITDFDDLVALYRDSGARRGISPNARFNEAAMREAAPMLTELVHQGSLPCLFAVELALGENVLTGFDHLPPRLQAALAIDPLSAPELPPNNHLPARRAPVPALERSQSDCIYSAWVARLKAGPDELAEIAVDDRNLTGEIASGTLLREPLVSIIMPSWNRGFTIGEAIQSVLEQSYPNWQLIVCDDASTDYTAEVVRGFDDPRIRYHRFLKSNGAGARNKGLRHARGEFIAYLDSDNLWHPGFLDLMIRKLLGDPGSQVAYSGFIDTETVGASVNLASISRRSFRPILLAERNFIDLNSLVHHRRLYDWMGGFDGRLPRLQDWDLVLRYTSVFRPVFVNRLGVFYRRNIAWGQLTHVQAQSNARSIVLAKTRDRLSGHHVELHPVNLSAPPVTVLPLPDEKGEFRPQDVLLAGALAEAASAVTPTDLFLPRDWPHVPASTDRLTVRRVDAAQLRAPAAELADMVSARPVLCVGPATTAEADGFAGLRYILQSGVDGGQFRSLDDESIVFSTGPVPLNLPDIVPARHRILLLTGDDSDPQKIVNAALKRGIEVVLPPIGKSGWQFFGSRRDEDRPDGFDGTQDIAGISLIVSIAAPDRLSPLSRGILSACQAQGVPLLTVGDVDPASDGIAEQWIEAGAARRILDTAPDMIAEEALQMLQGIAKGTVRMAEQARHCHAITDHPALFRQRLLHLCLRAASDRLATELVQDDDDAGR
ncbi:MAG: glycosyltransferase [Paracoccus denitrificans]|uniref:Glycosyltransferase n=1 Tax=Paracoccus denitrificans TaxID=266 RepID=A0A533I5G3_PARDE|nr:MAG: glycosyltransferase [Paracoccus denitrificans]